MSGLGRWLSAEVVVFLIFTSTFITPQNRLTVANGASWLGLWRSYLKKEQLNTD